MQINITVIVKPEISTESIYETYLINTGRDFKKHEQDALDELVYTNLDGATFDLHELMYFIKDFIEETFDDCMVAYTMRDKESIHVLLGGRRCLMKIIPSGEIIYVGMDKDPSILR